MIDGLNKFIPHYTYKLSELELRFHEVSRKCSGSAVFYSLKANSNAAVLRRLAEIGARAEVCTVGELKLAISAGFIPGQCLFGGIGKTKVTFESAIASGVRFFSLESIREIADLVEVEKALNIKVGKIIRVLVKTVGGRITMMGPGSKFGVTREELVSFHRSSPFEIDGIHVYIGTQLEENLVFNSHVALINALAAELEYELSTKFRIVNFGGGLAWPFMRSGEAKILDFCRPDTYIGAEAWFEFGRYIAGSSGSLRMQVLDQKVRDGIQVIILDAGLNAIGGMTAAGRVLAPRVDIIPLRDVGTKGIESAVYGPLCTPLDYLSLRCELPQLKPGDQVYIPNCGAYGFGTGMHMFLRHSAIEEQFEA